MIYSYILYKLIVLVKFRGTKCVIPLILCLFIEPLISLKLLFLQYVHCKVLENFS